MVSRTQKIATKLQGIAKQRFSLRNPTYSVFTCNVCGTDWSLEGRMRNALDAAELWVRLCLSHSERVPSIRIDGVEVRDFDQSGIAD